MPWDPAAGVPELRVGRSRRAFPCFAHRLTSVVHRWLAAPYFVFTLDFRSCGNEAILSSRFPARLIALRRRAGHPG